ncbi:MAG: AtpZ/AtpI family protein [Lachnospiraceae bacterium]|nr:AtpZ/AtpI family protein [Lachnospiraceae bacterium]
MNSKNRKRQKERQSTLRMLTLITQFGINMLVPIFLCFFVGYYLDKKLGTSYLMIIFFFIGALAGFRNIYIFARRMTKDDEEDTEDGK